MLKDTVFAKALSNLFCFVLFPHTSCITGPKGWVSVLFVPHIHLPNFSSPLSPKSQLIPSICHQAVSFDTPSWCQHLLSLQ